MSAATFNPTVEQNRIIEHDGAAFIAACPGSGKTRVLVERARQVLAGRSTGRGIAFLSFTNAAVSELEDRLRRDALLPSPPFPHFIGTFDAFLWQFLIAPFGVVGCPTAPRLIPDKDDRTIRPFPAAQPLPLKCFDRASGTAIQTELDRLRFRGKIKAHEMSARKLRGAFLENGELDFADARDVALSRLRDPVSSPILSAALAARFQELVVDEAQDCNPMDLEIINWFRAAHIPVKVICDPHQSIYGFRGGVTDELFDFGATFPTEQQMPLTGNFRSSRHIASAIVALRPLTARARADDAIGVHREEPTPIYILAYPGKSVPATVGIRFQALTEALGLDPHDCPVVSATRRSGSNALGHPSDNGIQDLTYRLAMAITDYHFSFELGGRKQALEAVHRLLLELEGATIQKTYHQHVAELGLEPGAWRPHALALVEALRFDPEKFATADAWLDEARSLLGPCLPPGGPTINQRMKRNAALANALSSAPPTGHCARTIHSVKGMEFPAVCVVMSTNTAKGILDHLLTSGSTAAAEDARKIYVGASRAQRLLVIAAPKSQAARLQSHLVTTGAQVEVVAL